MDPDVHREGMPLPAGEREIKGIRVDTEVHPYNPLLNSKIGFMGRNSAPKTNIISASRRTDVPKYYSEWFGQRIVGGFANYRTPFSPNHYRVSLLPEDVQAIVFWSKDPRPLIPYLKELEDRDYDFLFQFTITGMPSPSPFEKCVPPRQEMVDTFKQLADRYGPRRVLWRFDPILLSSRTDPDFYLHQFTKLARELSGATERCYFSFAHFYERARIAFSEVLGPQGITCYDPGISDKRLLAGRLAEIAGEYGMTLLSCCGDYLVGDGIKKALCIDGALINELFPAKATERKSAPTREGCSCTKSKDIGVMDTCPHGCVYCYANRDKELARKNFELHKVEAPILGGLPAPISSGG